MSAPPWELLSVNEQKSFVVEGMRDVKNGSFLRSLGETLAHADANNTLLICKIWPSYWNELGEWAYNKYVAEGGRV